MWKGLWWIAVEESAMAISLNSAIAAIAAVVLASLTLASAQEKRIKRSDLPLAVQRSVVEQSGGATIRGFSKEGENGRTLYEVHLTVNGHSKDVLMAPDGTVVELEEQVEIESLPPAVAAGLQIRAGDGKLSKVETLTKKGKLVAYEAQVLTKGKKSEVQVDPDGRPLDHEE
jgi:uncharacterized membrane protein YkoI